MPNILTSTTAEFALRLVIDLVFVSLLIRGVYYRSYRRSDLFLTFFAFNLVIFLIAYVLNSVEMTMGAAFGLFAVFSMLRYRTEGISATDMTYLFLGIAMGLMMAVSGAGMLGLVGIGTILLLAVLLLESGWMVRRELRQEVYYDRIELVDARRRPQLIEDLRARTGLNIHRVELQEIDLVRDSSKLVVYYDARNPQAPARPAVPAAPPETMPAADTLGYEALVAG